MTTLGELLDDFICNPPTDANVAVAYFPHPQADYWYGHSDSRPWIAYKGGIAHIVQLGSGLYQKLAPIMTSNAGPNAAAYAVGDAIKELSLDGAIFRTRYLRPAGLWPAPGKGRRHTPVTASHITNLLLAIICGSRKDSIDTVARFRGLPVTFRGYCHSPSLSLAQQGDTL